MFWKVYYIKKGQHVHCRIFATRRRFTTYANLGKLVFRLEEFTEFTRMSEVMFVEWVREMDPDGSLAGDDDVKFSGN